MKNTIKNILLFSFSVILFNQNAIAQTGSVGIGTTTPTNGKLEVQASTGQQALYVNSVGDNKTLRLRKDNGNFGARLNFGDSQYSWLSEDADDVLTLHSGSGLIFSTSGQTVNERMRITSAGNVGIGTTSPSQRLHVSGNGYFTGRIGIGVSSPTFKFEVDGSASIYDNVVIGNNATIGNIARIGTNPTNFGNYGLQVGYTGSPQVAANFTNNSPISGGGSFPTLRLTNEGITGHALVVLEGTVQKPGGGSWGAPSDRRLKQNITVYSEGLEQIKAIKPVTFQYNEKSGFSSAITYVGTIAQEVEKVAPHMVTHDGEYLGVDPSAFTYMLINAVQEQDQIITDQQKEIDELKARLDRIEAMLKK